MAASGFLLIASFLLVLFALAKPLGAVLARLIDGEPLPVVGRIEPLLWSLMGSKGEEMGWKRYLMAILAFNVFGLILLFAMLLFQDSLAA